MEGNYVASTMSNRRPIRFHDAHNPCRYGQQVLNTFDANRCRWFASSEEARTAGYMVCAFCSRIQMLRRASNPS